jgi:nucleoid-associated protein YgaU
VTSHSRSSRLGLQWLITGVTTAGLVAAGEGRLGFPVPAGPTEVLRWWSTAGPVIGAVALLRVAALIIGSYWLLLCSAVILARSCGRLMWLARLRLPGTNRLLRRAAGASMLGATVLAAAACGPGGANRTLSGHVPAPPVLVPVAGAPEPAAKGPQGPTRTGPQGVTRTAPPAEATTVPPAEATTIPPAQATTIPPAEAVQPRPSPGPSPLEEPAPSAGPVVNRWTVRPGDDLWSISESVLAARTGRRPDDRAVASLWLKVIEANRATLPDPANPDLIFAGEVIVVPD